MTLIGAGTAPGFQDCFDFNTRGRNKGNCGHTPDSDYIACASANVRCGQLQCLQGIYTDIYGPVGTSVELNTQSGACNSFGVPLNFAGPNPGLTEEGTKCGKGLVCALQHCVPVTNPTCPTGTNSQRCSGPNRGVCNNWGTCSCRVGFTGSACQRVRSTELCSGGGAIRLESVQTNETCSTVEGRVQVCEEGEWRKVPQNVGSTWKMLTKHASLCCVTPRTPGAELGPACSVPATETAPTDSSVFFTAPTLYYFIGGLSAAILLVIFLLLLFCCCCCCCRMRRKKASVPMMDPIKDRELRQYTSSLSYNTAYSVAMDRSDKAFDASVVYDYPSNPADSADAYNTADNPAYDKVCSDADTQEDFYEVMK